MIDRFQEAVVYCGSVNHFKSANLNSHYREHNSRGVANCSGAEGFEEIAVTCWSCPRRELSRKTVAPTMSRTDQDSTATARNLRQLRCMASKRNANTQ